MSSRTSKWLVSEVARKVHSLAIKAPGSQKLAWEELNETNREACRIVARWHLSKLRKACRQHGRS